MIILLVNLLNLEWLGNVYGICEVRINGKETGTQRFGQRIFPIEDIEIKMVMVNYMKTLKDNVVAQYRTSLKKKDQPRQSLGLAGPVTVY